MIDFKAMNARVDAVMNANTDRDELIATLCAKTFSSKAHVYAVLCELFGFADSGDEWEALDQDGRDFRTVYSQVAKCKGFIE